MIANREPSQAKEDAFTSSFRNKLYISDAKLAEDQLPARIVEKQKKKPVKFKKGMGIEPIKTDRDTVYEMERQKNGTLPGNGVMIFSGTTGSGKTVMICNLLGKKDMLKGYFERIFLFCLSPCPMLEDCLKLKKKDIINEDDPSKLEEIIDRQKREIDLKGFSKAPRILIICDDCAQSRKFLKHKVLQSLAFAATHSKISCWLTTQSYVQIPRNVRINAHYMALFHGIRKSELERFSDEYESPYLTKKEFNQMVKHATKEQYSFLFVNNRVSDKSEQFRAGFETIMKLDKNRIID